MKWFHYNPIPGIVVTQKSGPTKPVNNATKITPGIPIWIAQN